MGQRPRFRIGIIYSIRQNEFGERSSAARRELTVKIDRIWVGTKNKPSVALTEGLFFMLFIRAVYSAKTVSDPSFGELSSDDPSSATNLLLWMLNFE